MNDALIIPAMLLIPVLGSLAILLPTPMLDDRKALWNLSLLVTLATFVLSLIAAFRFDFSNSGIMQLVGAFGWIPGFGITFGYGMDAISLWLVLLTTFLMPLVVLGSLSAVRERCREYYFWLLMIEWAMLGTFLATDVVFFYVCFEFTLVPLFFLIGVFGSTDRIKAAKVFFLYTFTGSMLTFAGVLYVAWFHATQSGAWSFDIATLYGAAQQLADVPVSLNLGLFAIDTSAQTLVLLSLLAGFAVKVPLWPVHTWLPLAHTEAPTAGSVILAGVLLKLGTYGLIRFAVPMCPDALVALAPAIGVFAVLGILLTALICWVQKDVKKLIAYSSVSHLGFCVLGLVALDTQDIGAVGSVMYMINHGLSTGALFLCVGMIYERFHTREMADYSGLARTMPIWSFFTVYFVLASVGLPGLNGFIGEFLTLMGAFVSPEGVLGIGYAVAAGFGLIFGAIYLLYMVGRVVFGEPRLPHVHHGLDEDDDGPRGDLNQREVLTLAPIAVACLVLGILPYGVLRSLEAPVGQMTAAARALVEPAPVEYVDESARERRQAAGPGEAAGSSDANVKLVLTEGGR